MGTTESTLAPFVLLLASALTGVPSGESISGDLFTIEGDPSQGAQGIGSSSDKTLIGQIITTADITPGEVHGVRLVLGRIGDPQDDVVVALRATEPPLFGDLTSTTIPASSLPAHPDFIEVEVTFPDVVPSEQVRAVVLYRTAPPSGSFAVLRHDVVDPYPNGYYIECTGLGGGPCSDSSTDNDVVLTLFGVGDCGNGTVDPQEDCDEGTLNGTAGTCCATDCTFADGATCEDGDACTLEDTCEMGMCEPGAPTLLNPLADPDVTLECIVQTVGSLP